MIRPILEYTCQAWNPHQAYLIEKLERVQRNVTRWIIGKDTPYEDRLKSLKLPTLVQRREFLSLVQLFKFIEWHSSVNSNDFISFSNWQSRKSHQYQLYNPFLIIIYYIRYYLNKVLINKSYDCHSLRQMITFIVPMHSRKLWCVTVQSPTQVQILSILPLLPSQFSCATLGWSVPSSYQPHPSGEALDHLPCHVTSNFEHSSSFL